LITSRRQHTKKIYDYRCRLAIILKSEKEYKLKSDIVVIKEIILENCVQKIVSFKNELHY